MEERHLSKRGKRGIGRGYCRFEFTRIFWNLVVFLTDRRRRKHKGVGFGIDVYVS